MPYLVNLNGYWTYRRRVPEAMKELDPRSVAKQSTFIKVVDDPKKVRAEPKSVEINREIEAYWKGLVEGQAVEAERRYVEAKKRARAHGFEYLPAIHVAERPPSDILARLEKLEEVGALKSGPGHEATRAALLGGEQRPVILISQLFEKFEAHVAAGLQDMSEEQRRKWRNPKRRAAANLVEVIGDKAITEITHSDALEFADWWTDRVIDEEMHPDTANKDMGHLDRMVFAINRKFRLGIESRLFTGLRVEGGQDNVRPPYDPDYVRKRILVPGALDGLNTEARAVFWLILGTGLRPSEAVNLAKTTIHLKHNIPHVQVRPDGRRMKTSQSRRDVPLVGVALDIMREWPEGFPTYRDKSARLSATINKYLKENDLRQGGDRSVYSLRHMFKDQLINQKAEDSLIDSLMGHKEIGSKYGEGANLEVKVEMLHRIAFVAPADLIL